MYLLDTHTLIWSQFNSDNLSSDRLLIAQAKFEKMALISKDEKIPRYDIDVIW